MRGRGAVDGPGGRVGLAIGLGILSAIALVSLLASWVAPRDPNFQSVAGLGPDGGPLGPNARYLLGTDAKGRDLLSRLIYGGRVTFFACLVMTIAVPPTVEVFQGASGPVGSGWAAHFPDMSGTNPLRMDAIQSAPQMVATSSFW